MAQRDALVKFSEEILNSHKIEDEWCENGLQIEGAEKVHKIALGVSTSASFLQAAITWGAQMCLVHHGLFWRKGAIKIHGVLKKRLHLILANNLSLVNFHIPLDSHPILGNNAVLLKLLGLRKLFPVECGFLGEFPQALKFSDFEKLVHQKIGPLNFAANFSGQAVKKVGVISGGAASFAPAVKASGADAFLFGEMSEHDYHDLRDMGLSFVAAGHFATERFGVQELGKKISKKFKDVEVKFFDEDCPV